MERYVACECGFEAVSADADDLVRTCQRHACRLHGMRLTAEQILAEAREVFEGQSRPHMSAARGHRE